MTDLTTLPRPDNHVIVMFGATGDLARRKLLPALFHLSQAGLMPDQFRIVGTARTPQTEDEFRESAYANLLSYARCEYTRQHLDQFVKTLRFTASGGGDISALEDTVEAAEQELDGPVCRLLYLSIPPKAFADVVHAAGSGRLANAQTRVIVEKPFGHDLDSARSLNALLHESFAEEQILRIDHFLGKEDVQNILAFRFANGLFEPSWNNEHIDCIQIDVPETLGLEGRAGFYEGTGAFRDMIVTHLLQLLGVVAMEPPATLEPNAIADAKAAVFRALRPRDPARVVRGQYEGYLDEPGVAADSNTETLVALEAFIDNERWAGVPIYLRTGKAMPQGRRVVTLTFRNPEHELFPSRSEAHPVQLIFEIADPGGINLSFLAKEPGPTMDVARAHMTFAYRVSFDARLALEAYERLLHDAMLGDGALFARADSVERLWEVAAPLLANPPALEAYAPGSWGPDSAAALMAPFHWHLPDGNDAPTKVDRNC
jgi:glucose-6-phosphate 1-dehydrogenase